MSKPYKIALGTQKGGAGKTTSAVNLAHALTVVDENNRVLVLDFDPQANTTSILIRPEHIPPKLTIVDIFLSDAIPITDCILPSKINNVDLIPSTIDAFGLKTSLSSSSPRQLFALKNKAEQNQAALNKYDFVIIDCQPDIIGPFVANALCFADHVILPVSSESIYGTDGTNLFLGTMNTFKEVNPKLSLLGVLMTFFRSNTVVTQTMTEHVRSVFATHGDDIVFNAKIRNSTAIGKAELRRTTCLQNNLNSLVSEDYIDFAKEVIARLKKKTR